jgi:hypothetical protein
VFFLVQKYDLMFIPLDQNQVEYSNDPLSVAVGDSNNDIHLDIVVVNGRNNSISIFLGYGSDSFANQMPYSTGPLS